MTRRSQRQSARSRPDTAAADDVPKDGISIARASRDSCPSSSSPARQIRRHRRRAPRLWASLLEACAKPWPAASSAGVCRATGETMSKLKPKIVLSRLDGTEWTRKGLRPFLEYRDLGLAEAT